MRLISNTLLWVAAITMALTRRLTPFAVFIAKELILSSRSRLLSPAAAQPLTPPAPAGDLSALTRRQLQEIAGTRRNLPKAVLVEMVSNRPLSSCS
jgi:hypothetical protein